MYNLVRIIIVALILGTLPLVYGKGGVGKCTVCPQCMICNPFVGCVYDNFGKCTIGAKSGYCVYGECNTTLKVPSKPPICKTYKIVGNTLQPANDINGLDCTNYGDIFKSVCYRGTCRMFVDGLNLLGQNVGCSGMLDGTLCDTNGVVTDGETCKGGLCKMPANPQDLCVI